MRVDLFLISPILVLLVKMARKAQEKQQVFALYSQEKDVT